MAATTSPRPRPVPFAPIPMAMNASPSAMITTRPWRSAKWDGYTCQPVDPLSTAPK